MTVYVDDMYRGTLGKFGRMRMSHMFADTEEELHAMADKIGVARRWYQGDHYDISMGKRDLALKNGAVGVTLRIAATMMSIRRRTGRLPKPDECVPSRVKEAMKL